jgi:hypothetical protein
MCSKTPLEWHEKIVWRGSSCQVWYAKAWKIWPQTLICKIILIGSSTYIYNRITNANINYLKLKSGEKCVTRFNFSHMQRFLSQVSSTNNTLNVLLHHVLVAQWCILVKLIIILLCPYTLKHGNLLSIYFEKTAFLFMFR